MVEVADIKENIKTLLANGGINRDALFQTKERHLAYPGTNLHYLYTLVPPTNKTGIGYSSDSGKHKDIRVEVDRTGNFTKPNHVTAARQHCAELRSRFAAALMSGVNLAIINEQSTVNRRLKAGFA